MQKGQKHTTESKQKISKSKLGTNVTELTKQKLRKSHLGKKYKPMSDLGRKNISNALKGRYIGEKNHFYGKHHTKEMKKHLSEIKKGIRSYIMTNKTKEKLSMLAKKQHENESYEERLIINNKISNSKLGTIMSDDAKRKMREFAIKRLEKQYFENGIMTPCIGKYEKPMLDALEKCFGYEIKRQYSVAGYFIDGYCSALNLAIEIDEKYHQKAEQLSKDNYREIIIKNELQCNFVRIEV